jgi:hypothetical protein
MQALLVIYSMSYPTLVAIVLHWSTGFRVIAGLGRAPCTTSMMRHSPIVML